MNRTYLALGTNLGNKEENLRKAIEMISGRIGHIKAQSAFITTEPWGFTSPHTFLNAAICVETPMSPYELLDTTQNIEREIGRTEKTQHDDAKTKYADRIIDIDILLFYDDERAIPVYGEEKDWGGTLHIESERLTIPHPLMTQRDFVLIPLKEIL